MDRPSTYGRMATSRAKCACGGACYIIPGISSIRSSVARQRGPKGPSTQCLMSQFPTHPNREFFGALQGIKSGDQGNFFPHQGIRSRPLFGICFDDKCDRPDRPRLCREGEEGAARCSKPLKPISRSNPALVHVKGALGNSGNLAAKLVDANKRRFCIRGLRYAHSR